MKKKAALALGGGAMIVGVAAYLSAFTSLISGRKPHFTEVKPRCMTPEFQSALDASKRIKDIPMRIVSITNRTGLKLYGHWYPAEKPTCTAILVHGWHGAWHYDFSTIAPLLHDAGCNLLIIEQRCHNHSEGKLISYGVLERFDVEEWVEFTTENLSDLPLFFYGMSMGATTVLMASALPSCSVVRGIIADCGFTSPKEIISKTIKSRVGYDLPATVAAVGKYCKFQAKFSYSDYSAIDALKQNTNIPVMFIHGDADTFVPCEMTYRNYLACKAPKELLIVRGAEHGLSCVVEPELYRQKVLAFIDKYK